MSLNMIELITSKHGRHYLYTDSRGTDVYRTPYVREDPKCYMKTEFIQRASNVVKKLLNLIDEETAAVLVSNIVKTEENNALLTSVLENGTTPAQLERLFEKNCDGAFTALKPLTFCECSYEGCTLIHRNDCSRCYPFGPHRWKLPPCDASCEKYSSTSRFWKVMYERERECFENRRKQLLELAESYKFLWNKRELKENAKNVPTTGSLDTKISGCAENTQNRGNSNTDMNELQKHVTADSSLILTSQETTAEDTIQGEPASEKLRAELPLNTPLALQVSTKERLTAADHSAKNPIRWNNEQLLALEIQNPSSAVDVMLRKTTTRFFQKILNRNSLTLRKSEALQKRAMKPEFSSSRKYQYKIEKCSDPLITAATTKSNRPRFGLPPYLQRRLKYSSVLYDRQKVSNSFVEHCNVSNIRRRFANSHGLLKSGQKKSWSIRNNSASTRGTRGPRSFNEHQNQLKNRRCA